MMFDLLFDCYRYVAMMLHLLTPAAGRGLFNLRRRADGRTECDLIER